MENMVPLTQVLLAVVIVLLLIILSVVLKKNRWNQLVSYERTPCVPRLNLCPQVSSPINPAKLTGDSSGGDALCV